MSTLQELADHRDFLREQAHKTLGRLTGGKLQKMNRQLVAPEGSWFPDGSSFSVSGSDHQYEAVHYRLSGEKQDSFVVCIGFEREGTASWRLARIDLITGFERKSFRWTGRRWRRDRS